MSPSEYFHRNIFVSLTYDQLAIENRRLIGVDNLVWGSDYPHGQTTYPNSREILGNLLYGVPAYEARKIIRDNAIRLFQIASEAA
jgi:predicted TIM-barrel fold metal-dependent hydrolase